MSSERSLDSSQSYREIFKRNHRSQTRLQKGQSQRICWRWLGKLHRRQEILHRIHFHPFRRSDVTGIAEAKNSYPFIDRSRIREYYRCGQRSNPSNKVFERISIFTIGQHRALQWQPRGWKACWKSSLSLKVETHWHQTSLYSRCLGNSNFKVVLFANCKNDRRRSHKVFGGF